ncbi:tetrahydroberberine oxidase-like [Humulus lupulus]|uniref:tetrahydroberberine oxidase-like n=1 Tax=Humulus lupulus TaxID=3486 RepID=UPI002B401CAE|nr:tetrahydroberberine oxidase-like [Humulus lupulus]
MEYFFVLIIISSIFFHSITSNSISTDGFLECFTYHLQHHYDKNDPVYSKIILTKTNSHYTSLLQSSIRNGRFLNNSLTPKPEIILTPFHKSQVQAAVICSKRNELQIKVRSGGHDYEGLSYVSDVSPFMIIDLINYQSIKVDIRNEVALVEAGATLGQLYYEIAKKSKVHGFPAGSCSTVGVGGHFSGGGFGTIFRKYGLAADNILDAEIVNVNGEVLNRQSMGEDLFWAIRGGGGSSFGVILSWKVKLVRVPPSVTISHIEKTLDEGGAKLLNKWQTTGKQFHEDLFLHVTTAVTTAVDGTKKTIQVAFTSLFLGPAKNLVSLMDQNFPELGLQLENCTEMSWIQSVLYFAGFSINGPLEILANRSTTNVGFFKGKSDYVSEPISETGLEGLWQKLYEDEGSFLIWSPYGGRMSQISDSEIPFPHRSGNLYGIQYMVTWNSENETENHIGWMKRLYSYMAPYVSKSPRAAYFNYRDLDIGRNERVGNTSYAKARTWGLRYFRHNFIRLVRVKTKVDPCNYFRNEQSIPVLQSGRMKGKN